MADNFSLGGLIRDRQKSPRNQWGGPDAITNGGPGNNFSLGEVTGGGAPLNSPEYNARLQQKMPNSTPRGNRDGAPQITDPTNIPDGAPPPPTGAPGATPPPGGPVVDGSLVTGGVQGWGSGGGSGYSGTPGGSGGYQVPSSNGNIIGSQITAKTGNVTQDMLAQEQLRRITDANGPLMQQAEARAMQTANARGMQNGSLAAQAGQEAVIAAATPFALQDASTYFTNQRDNLAAENQYGLADKSAQLQDVLQGRDLENRYQISKEGNAAQVQSANIGAGATMGSAYIRAQVDREQLAQNGQQFAATLGYNREQAGLDRTFRAGESQAERDSRLALQTGQQNWQSGRDAIDYSWRAGESALDRDARIQAQREQNTWAGGQNTQAQDATRGNLLISNSFNASQNQMNRDATRVENNANRTFNGEQNQLNRDNSVTLAGMNIDANTRTNAAAMTNNNFQAWTSQRNTILNNPNMTADDKTNALAHIDAMYMPNPYFPYSVNGSAYKPATNALPGNTDPNANRTSEPTTTRYVDPGGGQGGGDGASGYTPEGVKRYASRPSNFSLARYASGTSQQRRAS